MDVPRCRAVLLNATQATLFKHGASWVFNPDSPAKRVNGLKPVSRVQISPSPPVRKKKWVFRSPLFSCF